MLIIDKSGKEHMMCKLNKPIYGLKQASKELYLTFDSVATLFGFVENKLDQKHLHKNQWELDFAVNFLCESH